MIFDQKTIREIPRIKKLDDLNFFETNIIIFSKRSSLYGSRKFLKFVIMKNVVFALLRNFLQDSDSEKNFKFSDKKMFDFETDRFNGVIVKLNELGNVEREKFSENLKTVN